LTPPPVVARKAGTHLNALHPTYGLERNVSIRYSEMQGASMPSMPVWDYDTTPMANQSHSKTNKYSHHGLG
jgi:hypothetical protein